MRTLAIFQKRGVVRGLLVVFALALGVAELALYTDRNLFDSGRFADHAQAALQEPAVDRSAAARLSEEIVRADPDLIAVEPVIRGVAEGVVGSDAFGTIVRGATYQAHASVFGSGRDTFALTLANGALLVVQALEAQAREAAQEIPSGLDTTLLSISEGPTGEALTDLAQVAEDVAALGWIALGLAALLLALAVGAAPDRRLAVRDAGVTVAVLAGLLMIVLLVGRAVAGEQASTPEDEAALRAIWDVFLGDLFTLNLALAATGLVVAAVAQSLVQPVSVAERARALGHVLAARPAGPRVRALRAGALIAMGLFLFIEPDAALRLVTVGAGLLVLALGVDEVLSMTALQRGDPAAGEEARAARAPSLRRRRIVVATGLGLLALAAPLVALAATDGAGSSEEASACNGSVELCERRIDEVAIAAAHNSMSSPDADFLFPNQQSGITAQLEGGIRGLLIDTHEGIQTNEGVYTVLREGGKSREKLEQALGREAVATAERLREQIGGAPEGEPKVHLCHGFCEIGAIDAVEALKGVRDFLTENPGEVVVISIEDQVTPARTAEIFEQSGLLDLVWTDPIRPAPTLGQMVERNRRVLVFGEENTAAEVPWYRPQFDWLKETPFDVPSAPALLSSASCRVNRGREENSPILLNLFVAETPPLPSTARKVNGLQDVAGHARDCAEALDGVPNLLAVDFWQEGDVVGAAALLNTGESPTPSPRSAAPP